MQVAVVGGAGYIGAHVVRLLAARGDSVTVVDDLSTGFRGRVPEEAAFVKTDLASPGAADLLAGVLRRAGTQAVVHFAAKKHVGESVARPVEYYIENVGGLAALLLAMERSGVHRLLFSSSAAVYGAPRGGVARESTVPAPLNPYGETKLVGEWLCRDAERAWGLSSVSLRYFNVAGAGWPDLVDPAALNLIPIVLERARSGLPIEVFGNDYATPDGTCIRDYVHVLDLAEAHLRALDYLAGGGREPVMNVGTGRGASVIEVLGAVEAAWGKPVESRVVARRPGDPASLVADPGLIHETLGWAARYGLTDIVLSAMGEQHSEETAGSIRPPQRPSRSRGGK